MKAQMIPGPSVRKWGLEGFLKEFTEGGKFTVEEIIGDIEAGKRQCWVVVNGRIWGVALTELETKGVCHITHLTGDRLRLWHSVIRDVEEWARSIGCTRMETLADERYEIVARRHGYEKTHILLEKEL